MTKRKYTKGKQIRSISELDNYNDFIYIRGKIWHPGWWQNLKYKTLLCYIDQGNVWLAESIRRK